MGFNFLQPNYIDDREKLKPLTTHLGLLYLGLLYNVKMILISLQFPKTCNQSELYRFELNRFELNFLILETLKFHIGFGTA